MANKIDEILVSNISIKILLHEGTNSISAF